MHFKGDELELRWRYRLWWTRNNRYSTHWP